jgi:hypothetical protein
MSRQADEGVEVLRAIWSAQGQSPAGLDDPTTPAKTCKKMADVGFDGLAGGGEDLRSAWRSRLAAEGKLNPSAGTVADLVMEQAPARPRP